MSERSIKIRDDLEVPSSELRFETSRSSGPGGQHVNKTESRVTLVFDLVASSVLDESSRQRIIEHCANRISKLGEFRISSQSHRSQKANREAVIERFTALLREALKPLEKRKPTKPSAAKRRKRVDSKRRHSTKKALRREPSDEG